MTGTAPRYLSSPRSLPQVTGSGPQVRNRGLSGFNPLFFKTAHTSPLNVHYCKYVSGAFSPGISREALRTQHGMAWCQLLGGPGEGHSSYTAAPQGIGQMRVLERQGRPSQLGGPPKALGSWVGAPPALTCGRGRGLGQEALALASVLSPFLHSLREGHGGTLGRRKKKGPLGSNSSLFYPLPPHTWFLDL